MIERIKRLPCLNLFKVLIGLALLVISLWGVDWDILLESLDQITLTWLLFVIATVVLSLFLKIFRSFLLLRNFGVKLSFSRITEAFFLGQAVNFLLPSRGGDILRLGYMSADTAFLLPQITAAVMLEKLLDLIAMTGVALGVSAYLPLERAFWVRSWLLPLSVGVTIGLLAFILFGPQIWSMLKGWLSRLGFARGKKWLGWGDQFVRSSLWLRSPRRLFLPVLMTLLIWSLMWGTNRVLFEGLSLQVPLIAGGLTLILGYIGVLPNLMPGNVGPFYFFVQLGMEPFGVPQEKGLAFTVILHAIVTLTPLIASGVSMLVSESVRKAFLNLWKSR
ncbi:MAG: flippase-like domain-containing protein [Anaerolineales bacterium]|nr:flippase-like domain-containing protein [Anaerolineales bacterium]